MKNIAITIFSIGWLIPLWLSGNAILNLLRVEIMPRLMGQNPLNSFPFIDFASSTFTIACVWLGLVIGYWTWRVTSRAS